MVKYICKDCNYETELSTCPVCGKRTDILETSIYWCKHCNIPLYEEVCPICGEKGKRIGSDIRPVFPEERLLLEVMLGEPFKYKDASVRNTAGNPAGIYKAGPCRTDTLRRGRCDCLPQRAVE